MGLGAGGFPSDGSAWQLSVTPHFAQVPHCGSPGLLRGNFSEQPVPRFLIVGVDHRHAHTDADVVKARLYSVTGDQELLVRVRVRVRVRVCG